MCQAVSQLEAETQQVFQENQQLNKQSTLLNNDVSNSLKPIYYPCVKSMLSVSVFWVECMRSSAGRFAACITQ